ncbi:GntR family transcriptional regulator [Paenibacillus mesophilus]|uniref:GntR family transcriptional regulator n=1 Tax=Paenibacillus mesophilus TaxID=2582849 RepID=UPI00110F35ED|nr:GntR family transcriptional regulator [Paenibacillus mesophilus]TMV48932.1 GntR family transcriptional regulator [Paenibacillus mesophilus]
MSQFRFDEQKATSLRHKITEDIRRAIFQGKLNPGDRLREVEISKQMGVSRGPVREAIRMLEQEGLLVSLPYKETTVAEISGEEVRDVLNPIRLIIENYAIRKALPNIGERELERLASFVLDMKDGAEQNNLDKIVEADLAFHEYVLGLADMPGLLSTWTSIYNRIHLHFMIQGKAYEDLNDLWREHDKLLLAIRQGDPDTIEQAWAEHIGTYRTAEA